MNLYTVFAQASSFQSHHFAQCEHQGVHPSCFFTAKAIMMPNHVKAPKDLQLLIGYQSEESQLQAQQLLLEEPIEEANNYLTVTLPNLHLQDEVTCRKPKYPQSPTRGSTIWMVRSNLQEQESEKEILGWGVLPYIND